MKDDLRQLIIKGKTDQVLKKLLKVAEELEDDRLREKVMLLSASYEKHSENELLGLSYGEEQRVSIAKINKALLHLINQLPDEPLTATKRLKNGNEAYFPKAQKSQRRSWRRWGIFLMVGLISSFIAGWGLFNGIIDKEKTNADPQKTNLVEQDSLPIEVTPNDEVDSTIEFSNNNQVPTSTFPHKKVEKNTIESNPQINEKDKPGNFQMKQETKINHPKKKKYTLFINLREVDSASVNSDETNGLFLSRGGKFVIVDSGANSLKLFYKGKGHPFNGVNNIVITQDSLCVIGGRNIVTITSCK